MPFRAPFDFRIRVWNIINYKEWIQNHTFLPQICQHLVCCHHCWLVHFAKKSSAFLTSVKLAKRNICQTKSSSTRDGVYLFCQAGYIILTINLQITNRVMKTKLITGSSTSQECWLQQLALQSFQGGSWATRNAPKRVPLSSQMGFEASRRAPELPNGIQSSHMNRNAYKSFIFLPDIIDTQEIPDYSPNLPSKNQQIIMEGF